MLQVEESGDRRGPAVVLLHGIGTAGWMWWHQVAALGDHHCLAVDLPGHGRSSAVPWVSLDDTAAQVAELMRRRTATARAHVVGLSLGGQVALSLLERWADVAERVVVSGVTAQPWGPRVLVEAQLRLTAAMLRSPRAVDAQARAYGLPPAQRDALAESLRVMSPATYRRIGREVSRYRLPPALASVPTPTLVLAGGDESELVRRAVADVAAVLPAGEGRIAPGLGHGWNVEAPDLFDATVRAWISGAPLPARLLPVGGR
ncbi:pimeloyl-ACP methyl ester carboxylesterase [Georgenia soli]|uniref:Pimeloyl-ACP methyl ester carboxylesterase n=1 Tax=Georgenia soli TaxID=638953 RepID=A0A2A9ELV7_9MICO|nr:alpha/beta fold hydrolase [Georgenia soli]PFG39586.1 pimeloyl-ACP methyl ester carboxylesterase [Georgenia soli]